MLPGCKDATKEIVLCLVGIWEVWYSRIAARELDKFTDRQSAYGCHMRVGSLGEGSLGEGTAASKRAPCTIQLHQI